MRKTIALDGAYFSNPSIEVIVLNYIFSGIEAAEAREKTAIAHAPQLSPALAWPLTCVPFRAGVKGVSQFVQQARTNSEEVTLSALRSGDQPKLPALREQ